MRNNKNSFGLGASFQRNSHHRTKSKDKSEAPTPFSGASLAIQKVKVVR
jgi:lysophospholipid acyltransferase (LPLAT)-like uncharacterized protein